MLRGYCTPNQKLACFVLYLKIVNTFQKKKKKYHTCILQQIVQGTQKTGIDIFCSLLVLDLSTIYINLYNHCFNLILHLLYFHFIFFLLKLSEGLSASLVCSLLFNFTLYFFLIYKCTLLFLFFFCFYMFKWYVVLRYQ